MATAEEKKTLPGDIVTPAPTMNTKSLFLGSLWEMDVCRQTDADRIANPEKYAHTDIMTGRFIDCAQAEIRKKKHKVHISHILKQVFDYNLKDSELSPEDLELLKLEYGDDWRTVAENTTD